MMAITVSLFKEFSAHTIGYDKYCDGDVQDAMVYLVGYTCQGSQERPPGG